jgi:hypothetical protein
MFQTTRWKAATNFARTGGYLSIPARGDDMTTEKGKEHENLVGELAKLIAGIDFVSPQGRVDRGERLIPALRAYVRFVVRQCLAEIPREAAPEEERCKAE